VGEGLNLGGESTRQTWGKQLVKSPRQACTGRETFVKVIKVQLGQNVVFPFLPIVFVYLITGAPEKEKGDELRG